MEPSYLRLHATGELARRTRKAVARLAGCGLCPRRCGADRLAGETGACGAGRRAVVASFNPHFGEEAVLVGRGGSGTVFFAGCSLGCVFCQNHDISRHGSAGIEATPEELAGVMLDLQRRGCHNINVVTPTHVVAQILEGLAVAVEHGLSLPLVWNSGGYDLPETLALLDGVVDIYMPDVKVWDPGEAQRLLGARDYPEHARRAVAAMHRQVGDLVVEDGLAVRGLLVRHLVLPGGLSGSGQWMEFLAGLSRQTWVNLMEQYHPCGGARYLPPLDRLITRAEFAAALAEARKQGLTRLDGQGVIK
ncbi:radical SAM protein [Pseudodesulfovibrio pelocollis]|uniref:radical SAM protein n=1 Tax=Pseudodesulfovibrio pelocollis TaxID=3051432 RepID=UPI00255AD0DE|nr:radical SAM protein [Pseudodesulfovibrio sp. SB368]